MNAARPPSTLLVSPFPQVVVVVVVQHALGSFGRPLNKLTQLEYNGVLVFMTRTLEKIQVTIY